MFALTVESFPVGPLGCNCTILCDNDAKKAIVIDPGGDFELIRKKLDALGASVQALVHTHTHFDHVGATAPLQRYTGAKACIHEADRFLYDLLPVQTSMFGMACPEKTDMEGSLVDGLSLHAGTMELCVLHTPGHTPGSCSFYVKHDSGSYVFTGDTLFRRSIGRTDLWGGDGELIQKSIKQKLLTLSPETIVISGHGANTSIGEEKERNPLLRR